MRVRITQHRQYRADDLMERRSASCPARPRTPQVVMLGCHYDGHDISQGAVDPASGAVAVMEAARVLAKYGGRLPHTIRFAILGRRGDRADRFAAVRARPRRRSGPDPILLQHGRSRRGQAQGRNAQRMAGAGAVFRAWQEEMALDFAVGETISAHSDHFPFLMAGVPTGGMEPVRARSQRARVRPYAVRYAGQGGDPQPARRRGAGESTGAAHGGCGGVAGVA